MISLIKLHQHGMIHYLKHIRTVLKTISPKLSCGGQGLFTPENFYNHKPLFIL